MKMFKEFVMYLVHFKVDSHKLQFDECGCESLQCIKFIFSTEAQLSAATK